MNILEIKDNIKICTELNTSGVTPCVIVIPQSRLLPTLEKMDNKDFLASLSTQAQINILQNTKIEELFEWVSSIGGVKPSRASIVLESTDTVELYLDMDRGYLKRILLDVTIPESLM